MGPEGTELNLDGISKPELEKIGARAADITELSMNSCKLVSLDALPELPALYKLILDDNNLTSLDGLAKKCPMLLELSLSGNKKLADFTQMSDLAKLNSLMRLELEGCAIADKDNYRDEIFKQVKTLEVIDSLNQKGEEVPDDEDDEEDEEYEESDDEEENNPGLAALMGDDLGSDDDDGDYDSNEEPDGSDGEQDESEPENDTNEGGAGPSGSGLSKPPAKRQKLDKPVDDSDSD